MCHRARGNEQLVSNEAFVLGKDRIGKLIYFIILLFELNRYELMIIIFGVDITLIFE